MIARENIKYIYNLSPAQKGILFHTLLEEASTYIEQMAVHLTGDVKEDLLEQSFQQIVDRHDGLRTVFLSDFGKEPLQIVLKNHPVSLVVKDYSCNSEEESRRNYEVYRREDRKKGFQLQKEPPIRLSLIHVQSEQFILMLTCHHIILDGWSVSVLFQELFECYLASLEQRNPCLKNPGTYQSYIKWLEKTDLQECRAFWMKYLKDYVDNTALPRISARKDKNVVQQNIPLVLSEEVSNRVKEFSHNYKVTINDCIQSIWAILLQQYSRSNEVLIPMIISGREGNIPEIENIVGLFINTILLRIGHDKNTNVLELIQKFHADFQECSRYGLLQLSELCNIGHLGDFVSRHLSVFENYPSYSDQLATERIGFHMNDVNSYSETTYDLSLVCVPKGKNIVLNFYYNVNCYAQEMILQLTKNYEMLINLVLSNPTCRVSDLEIVNPMERDRILYSFNQNTAKFDFSKTIDSLMKDVVAKQPNHIAIRYQDACITYQQLYNMVSSISCRLLEFGFERNTSIAVLDDISMEAVATMLAILKTGFVYVPVDPNYPKERIRFILEDSQSKVVFYNPRHYQTDQQQDQPSGIEWVSMDSELTQYHSIDSKIEVADVLPEDLAYILYTSGTTGNPKGVMIERRSLMNQILGLHSAYDFNGLNHILMSPLTFDPSIQQILLPLTTGGTLRLISKEEKMDPKQLIHRLLEDHIDVFNAVPVVLQKLVEEREEVGKLRLKFLILAGEEFTLDLYQKIKERIACERIINIYGPTEATINATLYECNGIETEKIPIGKPLINYKVYIFNENKKLVPVGVTGELYIGGIGLARGYRNLPELTKDKFINNPYISEDRIYKTGDLARWSEDGNIEYIGRVDFQVKIRGMRIELDEIQRALSACVGVKNALILDKIDQNNNKYLCAYYIGDTPISVADIKRQLRSMLPEHMIPTRYICLKEFPLTSHGKIDRKALPDPPMNLDLGEEYVAPSNWMEDEMVQIWEKVLGVTGIGVLDNFFELGGDSLKSISLAAAIKKQKNVEIPIRDIFLHPTVRELLQFINQSTNKAELEIEKAVEKEVYEVSAAQRRMYTIQTTTNAGISYNLPIFMKLEGEVNSNRIENTIRKLIERHEILRTSFYMDGDRVVQKIGPQVEFHLEQVIEDQDIFDSAKYIKEFDLQRAPLIRGVLIQYKNGQQVLMIDMHHIISDEVSAGIFMEDFQRIYKNEEVLSKRLQYKDYSEWQNQIYRHSQKYMSQKEYWFNQMKPPITPLELPYDFERPEIKDFQGDTVEQRLSPELTQQIKVLSKATETTLFMILYSAFQILLYQMSGQEDILVGTPIMGRPQGELQDIIGMFVNTVVLRFPCNGNDTYLEFLQYVKKGCLDAYENQEFQFDELVEEMEIPYDRSRNPLFDVMFVMQNIKEGCIVLDNLKLIPYKTERKQSKLDLTMTVKEIEGRIELELEYSTKLFHKDSIIRMLEGYQKILHQITEKQDIRLFEISIVPEKELQLYRSLNDTKVIIPKVTIVDLIEQQVERTPDSIALEEKTRIITYRELNEGANQIARWLIEQGIAENETIGIMMERSCEMIMVIIGILKAGCCYIPMEPDYPMMRKQYIWKDCGIRYLFTDQDSPEIPEFTGKTVTISEIETTRFSTDNLAIKPKQNHLAYIIYTSGSTGQPKGVMIEHHSLTNYVIWAAKNYLTKDNSNMPFYSMVSFDLTVTSIFAPLISGNKLVVYGNQLGNYAIKEIINDNKVEVMKLTPAHLRLMKEIELPDNCKLRTFIVGGENLETALAEQITQKFHGNIEIFNEYGPTEATVGCMIHRYQSGAGGRSVSIGKPADNVQIYVLGKNRQLLPVNIAGEMYIGGEGIARGYKNREELTKEHFIDSPFHKGERLYRTGDIARWKMEGTLEFLGRADDQIKIRGFRIELGEIHSALIDMPEIKEAVVLDQKDSKGHAYLCAYLIANQCITPEKIKERLKERIPGYMVPDCYAFLDEFPLTTNGKLDRKALPHLEYEVATSFTAPVNQMQDELINMWKDILDSQEIGIQDNFFELGGDSLASIRLVGMIERKYQIEISVKSIFDYPTVELLSDYLRQCSHSVYQSLKRVTNQTEYPASSPQKRMYTMQMSGKAGTTYNVPMFLELIGTIDREHLENVIHQLIARHEILRTSFVITDTDIMQMVHEQVEFSVSEAEMQTEELHPEKYVCEFDLSKAPLFRVVLLHSPSGRNLLMIDMHHIISDGMSMELFLREFITLYQGDNLENMPYQYKDYSEWHRTVFRQSEYYQRQEAYWLKQLQNITPIDLCNQIIRPLDRSFEGSTYRFEISESEYSALKELSKSTGCTSFMILLSVFEVLLARLSGQSDIAVGTPMMGRPHPDLRYILGMFVNSVVIRNSVDDRLSYLDFLKNVKETALLAYDNQEYQFDELVQRLGIRTEPGRNPLFDHMFVMQQKKEDRICIKDLEIIPMEIDLRYSKLDLTLMAFEGKKSLSFLMEYSTALFEREDIEEVSSQYLKFLRKILAEPNVLLMDLQILEQDQKQEVSMRIKEYQDQLLCSAEFEF